MISPPDQRAALSTAASDLLLRSHAASPKPRNHVMIPRLPAFNKYMKLIFRGRPARSFLCFGYSAYLRTSLPRTDLPASIRFSLGGSTLLPAYCNPVPPRSRWAVSPVHLPGSIFLCPSAKDFGFRQRQRNVYGVYQIFQKIRGVNGSAETALDPAP